MYGRREVVIVKYARGHILGSIMTGVSSRRATMPGQGFGLGPMGWKLLRGSPQRGQESLFKEIDFECLWTGHMLSTLTPPLLPPYT